MMSWQWDLSLPCINGNSRPPDLSLLGNSHCPTNIGICIWIPGCMHWAGSSSEIHHRVIWMVILACWFNLRCADFHNDKADGFGGVYRWAWFAWFSFIRSKVIRKQFVEIWSFVSGISTIEDIGCYEEPLKESGIWAANHLKSTQSE